MNGDYLSYYPQFESNQVLTSTHLNELRRYLDEQIRLTRAQLNGVGIACGLTFEIADDQQSVRVYEGFGVSSEGYLICLKGEFPPENSNHASPGGFSDYIKCRTYKDPSSDLYWSTGSEAAPVDMPILELLTKVDAEQLVLDGTDIKDIHDITPSDFSNKVLVLYLEQNDIALKTCAGKDCDNKGSKRYLTARLLLIDREARAEINKSNPAEIVMTGLDGMLIRQPFPIPIGVPRLIRGLEGVTTLQKITTYSEIADGYAASIAVVQNNLADAIEDAFEAYAPFLGLTERGISRIGDLRGFNFPPSHVQYGHDLLKDIARGLNEFTLAAYELKRDCCNDSYNFPRHLMLGTAIRDSNTNNFYHDKYRNYFVNFAMTADQDRRLRMTQLLFQRIILQIKAFIRTPPNNLAADSSARMVPSMEDAYPVGKGTIPDYYRSGQIKDLQFVWDPEKTINGQEGLVLSFNLQTAFPHFALKPPFGYDIDRYPFLRVQNMIGLNVKTAEAALRKSMVQNNLPFQVVSVMLGDQTDRESIADLILEDCCFAPLNVQYQSLRVHIHAMVAKLQAISRKIPFEELEKGIAMPIELQKRFIKQTPVAENVLIALTAENLFEFVKEDGLPNLVKGLIPPEANDSPASLFQYMYAECRTFAQYLEVLLKYWLAKKKRNPKDPCDLTSSHNEAELIADYLKDVQAFLADNHGAVLTSLISQTRRYLMAVSQESPMLFHNFAKAHPGLEHLGGTYKGGTYVLVYERIAKSSGPKKVAPGKGDTRYEPEVREPGKTREIDGENEGFYSKVLDREEESRGKYIDEGKEFFKSAFQLDQIFDDAEGAEFWMDAEFEKGLERPELKGFLVSILEGLSEVSFSKGEAKTIENETVESLFGDYLDLMAARAGRLVRFQVEAIQEDYIKAIQNFDLKSAKFDVNREELDTYVEYIETPSELEAKLPSAEEAAALTKLLVELLNTNDRYLDPGQVDGLDGLTPQDVWPEYLKLIEAKIGSRLSLAAINELTTDYLKILNEVGPKTLLTRDIRSATMASYIESIKNGTIFEVEVDEPILGPLLAFLIEQVKQFGHIILSKEDFELLADSTVETFWEVYLKIYADAVGERHIDADLQRSLTAGFMEQLECVDEAELIKEKIEDTLPSYIDALGKFGESLAAEAFPDKEDVAVLMDVLVDILEEVVEENTGDNPFSINYTSLKSLEPEALWPRFVADVKVETDAYSDEDFDLLKDIYAQTLFDFVKSGGIIDRDLAMQLERYITYVGAAGPSDNPYLRAEIVTVLHSLGLGVLTPRSMVKLEDQAVSVIWPQFVRTYLRVKGKSYDAGEIATLQATYIDKLKSANPDRLKELGIDELWEDYIVSLSNAQPPVEDLGGMLVGFIVSVLRNIDKIDSSGIDLEALLLLPPAEVLPVWLDQVIANEELRSRVRRMAIEELVNARVPRFAPAEFYTLWEAYLAMLTGKEPTATVSEVVVADFSLPYRIDGLGGLPKNIEMPKVLPPIITGGDTGYVKPGAAIDIRLLENDDLASGIFAEDRRDLEVEILHVIQPPGGLGGAAHLIQDPNSSLVDAPKNILRYEAFWGETIAEAEVVEIVYRVTEASSKTTATGTVLIFVSDELDVISDPCCCCKDYSYVAKKGEKLTITDIFKDFEDQGSFVLSLVGADGKLYTTYDSDEFRGVVLRKSIDFTSIGAFEGTVSFGYHVSYAKGRASCEGRITVHVVCPCLELPCEVSVNLQPGETVTVNNILTSAQIGSGVKLRLNDGGNDVLTIANPDPLIKSATVVPGKDLLSSYTTIEVEAGGSAGQARIPFFKGIIVGKEFLVQGECEIVINLVNTACTAEANMVAGEGKFITSALSSAEVTAGTVLRFVQAGSPSMTLSPTPLGFDVLRLTKGEQGFAILPNIKASGDITFEYFKGDMIMDKDVKIGARFVPSVKCTMTIHIAPSQECIEEYTLLENQTLVISDLLTAEDLKSKIFLHFDDAGVPASTIKSLPPGAAAINLVASGTSGVANSAFILQPDLGFNGVIEWPYFKVVSGLSGLEVVYACTIRVTVTGAPDCNKEYTVASGVELLISEPIMKNEEIRFYNGAGRFDTALLMSMIGVDTLELDGGDLLSGPTRIRFKSTRGYDGVVVFRMATGRVVDGTFMASRICTVTITVQGAPDTFTHNVIAPLGRGTIYDDLISPTDMGLGIDRMRFVDGAGAPSTNPPFDFNSGSLNLVSGGLPGTDSDSIAMAPSGSRLGVVTVRIAKGKMDAGNFVSIVEGDLNIDIVPNADCILSDYTNTSGKQTLLDDLLTQGEHDSAFTELRFFENGGVTSFITNLPAGLSKIELVNDISGKPKDLLLESQSSFEGTVSFQIAVVQAGRELLIMRICTVSVEVRKGAIGNGFNIIRNAPNTEIVQYDDILTELDVSLGINELRFISDKGVPTLIPPTIFGVALLEIVSNLNGMGSLKFEANGSISGQVTIQLAKGKMSKGVFVEHERGTLTIDIAGRLDKKDNGEGVDGFPSYSYDTGFTSSKYYDADDDLQSEAIQVLDTMERVANFGSKIDEINSGALSTDIVTMYQPMLENLRNAILNESNSYLRAYYLRLFALELAVAFEVTTRMGDITDGSGLDQVFVMFISSMSDFRSAGYYDPNKVSDRITAVLMNVMAPDGAVNMNQMIVNMSSL